MNKSYVLRAGRFTAAQKRAYACGEKFIVPFCDAHINPGEIFGVTKPITVEVGFGAGLATAIIAEATPGKNYLGVEVHRPGIGRLLWEIEKRNLSNIRIIEHDAVEVIEKMIADMSLEAIHIFFPDPWPKKRHNKRRLVQRPFTETLAGKLVSGGYLYMVTDWEDYANYALAELEATATLRNAYGGFAEPQPWRPQTRFEQKGIAKNHAIWELFFVRE
ncbi:MAG: tRNA (guanosine(46)-N7)-methyltransferase TrmB [Treponema sp.]|nr:tRNA (guanosine(46)-N7)-methyltransferase TrmB [Treponema sp.]